MKKFTRTINGMDFNFDPSIEGGDEVCNVHVENQSFKMTVDEKGNWHIRQQVPSWIKELEADIGQTIDNEDIQSL